MAAVLALLFDGEAAGCAGGEAPACGRTHQRHQGREPCRLFRPQASMLVTYTVR